MHGGVSDIEYLEYGTSKDYEHVSMPRVSSVFTGWERMFGLTTSRRNLVACSPSLVLELVQRASVEMLLNASHKITNCGLPQHVQERYVRYKQGNRAIVAWMTRYGPEKYKGRKALPIKQLIALGKLLCEKVSEIGTLPPDVDYYFEEVIKERAYLSEHFRTHRDQCEKDEIDTVNHEHFTESLKQIHQILLTAGKPFTGIQTEGHFRRPRSSTSSIPEVRNGFIHLLNSSEDEQIFHDSDDGSLSDADTEATSECSHSRPSGHMHTCEGDEDVADFLDTEGQLGLVIESLLFLTKIKSVTEAIKTCWVKAGRGDTPVAVSSAYTNVLLTRANSYVRAFHENEPDLLTFTDMKRRLQGTSCTDVSNASQPQHVLYELLEDLDQTHGLLFPVKSEIPRCALSSSSSSSAAVSLVHTLISNLNDAFGERVTSSLSLEGLSFIEDFGCLLDGARDDTKVFALCTTLYLLSVSHRAYCSTLHQPTTAALPRISALKVANQALSSIRGFIDDKSIFPCQCVNTLGYRVVQMRNELESFAKYRCWNALMQSAHVAGNHVLEILDLCSHYGMHLFHYRQYVAAVLHTYHALVQLKYVDKMAVLEDACDLFAPILYTTGIRPASGFMASWLRYIGARLRFKKGRKHRDHKDTWCMSVPAHAAARSAGLNVSGRNEKTQFQPKFDFGTIDYTMKLKHGGWILSEEASCTLGLELEASVLVATNPQECTSWHPDTAQKSGQKARHARHKHMKSCHVDKTGNSTDSTESCLKLDHTLHASFTVDESQKRNLPSSRINLLAIFHSMTGVVSGISDTTHAVDDKSGRNTGRGQMCLCFVQTIIRAADRIIDTRRRNGIDSKGAVLSKNEKECVECYKKHLMEVLEDGQVLAGAGGAWLWASI